MVLSQCLYLHKNFSLLFSIISLGNGKLKYYLQSFIISIFDDLNNSIKNRVGLTTESSERRSALIKLKTSGMPGRWVSGCVSGIRESGSCENGI